MICLYFPATALSVLKTVHLHLIYLRKVMLDLKTNISDDWDSDIDSDHLYQQKLKSTLLKEAN